MTLQPGMTNELTVVVNQTMTARQLGGADLEEVLATPMLVNYLENAAQKLVEPTLAEGQGTVGSRIDIRHLAATPVGMQVTFRATLAEIADRRLIFRVEADDQQERVGEGSHERYVIDKEKFLARLTTKANSL